VVDRHDLPAGWGSDLGVYHSLSGKAASICEELERRILAGVYSFGDMLPTADLVTEFKISRAPLTAALNQLRAAGYLSIIPQVGSQVITPTAEQVHDFYLMFSRVEGVMARFAAERRSEEDVVLLREIGEYLSKEAKASPAVISDHYIELLLMYHDAILMMARSRLEVDRARNYRRVATFYLRNGLPGDIPYMLRVSTADRVAVTEAIAAGDPDQAEVQMARYVLAGSHINN